MAEKLEVQIVATDQASGVLKTIDGNITTTTSRWKAMGPAIGAAATAGIGLMSDLAREGAADAASMEAVRVAVENTGASWDTAEGQLSAYIDGMRDSSAIADDELKPALAGLIAVTGDYNKSMELAGLAADIARGKNISLQSAADLVGKVAMGNTSTLSRYGIVLEEGATATEALGELQKRFAGQAEAYGKTQAGQMEIVGLKVGDFREQVGQTMGPAMGFVGMLPGLSTGFTAIGGAVGLVTPAFGGLATMMTGTAIPAIGATVVALAPILIPIAAIGAAVGLLALAWSNNWGDIQGKTQAVIGFLRIQLNNLIGFLNTFIRAWNGLEFRIPGFSVQIPSVEIPFVGTVGGGSLGWEGLHVSTPNLPTIPMLGAGGLALSPTLAIVGDRPEAIVPLDRAVDTLGRSVTVNGPLIGEVHVHNEADENRLIEKLRVMLYGDLRISLGQGARA
jgi:hypothetical protein